MENQTDKARFGTDPRLLVRRNDPDTSVEAAMVVDTSRLETLVYEEIKQYGYDGCISHQLLNSFPFLPYSSVTARYRALLDKHLIEDTGERRVGRSGRKQRVMRVIGD